MNWLLQQTLTIVWRTTETELGYLMVDASHVIGYSDLVDKKAYDPLRT